MSTANTENQELQQLREQLEQDTKRFNELIDEAARLLGRVLEADQALDAEQNETVRAEMRKQRGTLTNKNL
jgi:uncharacterized protein YdcH (DUF465 family)